MSSKTSTKTHTCESIYFGAPKNQCPAPQKIGTRKFSDPVGTFDQQTGQYKESLEYLSRQDKRQEILIGDLHEDVKVQWNSYKVCISSLMPDQWTLVNFIFQGSTFELARALEDREGIKKEDCAKASKLVEDILTAWSQFLIWRAAIKTKKLQNQFCLLFQAGMTKTERSLWSFSDLNVSSFTNNKNLHDLIDLFLEFGIKFTSSERELGSNDEIIMPSALHQAIGVYQHIRHGNPQSIGVQIEYSKLPKNLERLVVASLELSMLKEPKKVEATRRLRETFSSTFGEGSEFEDYLKAKGQTLQGASPSNYADFVKRRVQKREAPARVRLCRAFPRRKFQPLSLEKTFQSIRQSEKALPAAFVAKLKDIFDQLQGDEERLLKVTTFLKERFPQTFEELQSVGDCQAYLSQRSSEIQEARLSRVSLSLRDLPKRA